VNNFVSKDEMSFHVKDVLQQSIKAKAAIGEYSPEEITMVLVTLNYGGRQDDTHEISKQNCNFTKVLSRYFFSTLAVEQSTLWTLLVDVA